jgi:hypothetical protein
MPSSPSRTPRARRATHALLAPAVLATVSCEDADIPIIDSTPTLASVLLTVTPAAGSPTQFVWDGGATVTPRLRVPVGTSTLAATVRGTDGAPLNESLAADYELRMVPTTGALAFTRNTGNPFAGRVTADATTAPQSVTLCLYDRDRGRCELGSTTTAIPVTVGG